MKEWITKIESAIENNRKRKISLTNLLADLNHEVGIHGGISKSFALKNALSQSMTGIAVPRLMIERMDYQSKIAYLIRERLADIPEVFWKNKEIITWCEELEHSYDEVICVFNEILDLHISLTVAKR